MTKFRTQQDRAYMRPEIDFQGIAKQATRTTIKVVGFLGGLFLTYCLAISIIGGR